MRIGVVFPQTEIGADVGAIRAYGQAVDELGYAHLVAYDHVLGADPAVHAGWDGPYDVDTTFHEPMVLFGYLAAITSLELVTGVLVLPQRQTALVAKQAAEVDLLTGGHFRLGIGVGWNAVEYDALGKDFTTRGTRSADQVELLRRLWTQRTVTFAAREELVVGAGIAPRPIQRPIPIWIGGHAPVTYQRIGRFADGWFPQVIPGPALDAARAAVEASALAAGRDPATLGMEGIVNWTDGVSRLVEHAGRWRSGGVTHLSINTMRAGLASVDDHIAVLNQAAAALGVGPPAG
jgi:probable F420-dependent oxidoreductase